MTPTDYEEIARQAAEAEERRRLAALELRGAILRGEASSWGPFERAQAYNLCGWEQRELPKVEAFQDAYDAWERAGLLLRRLAEVK